MKKNKKIKVFFLQLRRKDIKSAKKMLDFSNWICLTVVCKNCTGKKIKDFQCAKKSDVKTTNAWNDPIKKWENIKSWLNQYTIFNKEIVKL